MSVESCRKEDHFPPLIITLSAKEITDTSALTGGIIVREGSIPVTERGIVWSTEPDPDLNFNTGRINEGSGEGKFTITLGDLLPEKTYYVRAYAINSTWTIYGETISFRTFGKLMLPCEECEDTGIIPPGFKKKILCKYYIRAMAFDQTGNAWIATNKGLIKYNSNNCVVYNFRNALPENPTILDIEIDKNGIVWIGTGIGLIKFDGAKFTLFNSLNSPMPEDIAVSIAIDDNNNLWFSSSHVRMGGLVKFDGINWTVFTPENSKLPRNFIQSVIVDHQNNIWLALSEAVDASYLVRISGDEWKIFTKQDWGFPVCWFGNLEVNSKNVIYGAIWRIYGSHNPTAAQIIKFDGISAEKLIMDGYSSMLVSISIDNQDNLWCCTPTSYGVYDGLNWIVFDDIGLITIEQSNDNKLWFGTDDGIYIKSY